MKLLLKRLAALNLALVMLLTLLPVSAAGAPAGVAVIGPNDTVCYYHPSDLWIGRGKYTCAGGGSGTGWRYIGGVLYLDESYPGYPIQAADDLILSVSGTVTIRNETGPALVSDDGCIHVLGMQDPDARLTVVSGRVHAVSASGSVYIESPANVEFIAPEGVSASAGGIYYDGAIYAEHRLLANRTFTGTNRSSAREVNTINIYQATVSGSTLLPYQSYIRFEGRNRAEQEFRLTLDPGQGKLPGRVGEVRIPLDEADLSEYGYAVLDLSDLPDPSRSGFVFTGWVKEPDASACYRTGDALAVTGFTTRLHAAWAKKPDGGYVLFDGGGKKLDSPQMEYAAADVLEMTDGTIVLPDNHAEGFVGWYPEKLKPSDLSRNDFFEGLYFPGQSVSLPSGTVLYAVYSDRNAVVIHGNGYQTANGNDRILVMAGQLQNTPGSLEVYSKAMEAQVKAFFRAEGKVLLDYNTRPDGSGEYNGVAETDVYAQWVDAPAGSVLLYSDTPAVTEDGRYGKILTAEEAQAFDPANSYGFAGAYHDFAGWYSGSSKVEDTLPESDESGYVILYGQWDRWRVSYDGTDRYSDVDDQGTVAIAEGDSLSGKTFNGWNTRPDGSGAWFLPGRTYAVSRPFTLYPQYLNTPEDGDWVLAERKDGNGLYQHLETSRTEESETVSVTMPESETGWIMTDEWSANEQFGYYGGETYEIMPRIILKEGTAPCHGNGGTFRNGTEVRTCISGGTSGSSLALYPTEADFVTRPEGMVLTGWSTQKEFSPNAVIYQPGASGASESGQYYAIWDSADTVYVMFEDKFNDVDNSFSLRGKAGEIILLPEAEGRFGYQLDGWMAADGTLFFPGNPYAIPEEKTTLTAVWSEQRMLVVDGENYDPTISHDYSAEKGWKYEAADAWKKLWLTGYNGGEIGLPGNTEIYLSGENTVTAETGKTAISSEGSVEIGKYTNSTEEINSLWVKGGDGACAVDVQRLTLNHNIAFDAQGGSGAAAVQVAYSLAINSGHARIAGSGAPAVKFTGTNSHSFTVGGRYALLFAGDSPETAEEISGGDYRDESCVFTQPRLYTLTLNAGAGKVNGRAEIKLQAEYGQKVVRLDELDIWYPDASLMGWYDGEGQAYTGNVSLYGDMELAARWNISPYDRYIYLDGQNAGSVNGKEGGDYMELPGTGTVRLPEVTFKETYADYIFEYWYLDSETDRRYFPANMDIPVEWLQHGDILRPSYRSQSGETIGAILIHPGDTAFDRVIGFDRIWLDSSTGKLNARTISASVDGRVIDSLNTRPDGSGVRYEHGDVIPLEADSIPVLYARWKADHPTYITQQDGENAPQNTDVTRYFAYTTGDGSGEKLADLLGWRTEDGRIYACGEKTDLPTGTTLFAFYGNSWAEAVVSLVGNGADGPVTQRIADTTRDNNREIYVCAEGAAFVREGYALTGWNTSADGSGTAYPIDVRFRIGSSDANGGNWTLDAELFAAIPKKLYAQWEKLPAAELPVPLDMAETENAVIWLATYDESGRLLDVRQVDPDAVRVAVYEQVHTYQFFCLTTDGSILPLTVHEAG